MVLWLNSAFLNRLSKRVCKVGFAVLHFVFRLTFSVIAIQEIYRTILSQLQPLNKGFVHYTWYSNKKRSDLKNVPNSICCYLNEKFGAHANLFFVFLANWIFAQKVKICWNVPVLSKNHLIFLQTNGSHCVSSWRKILAFSTFFSDIGDRKTNIPTQLTYFYVWNETKYSSFCFFCFWWWIDWNWEETWCFNRTSWKKNPKTVFRSNENIFSFTVSCLRSQLNFTQVWLPHFWALIFLLYILWYHWA